jgi:hypothetical protein
MRLDTVQLPRPLQVSALTNRALRLESSWKTIIFRPPQAATAPPAVPVPAKDRSEPKRESREGATQ